MTAKNIIITVSLLANVVFGYFLFRGKPTPPPDTTVQQIDSLLHKLDSDSLNHLTFINFSEHRHSMDSTAAAQLLEVSESLIEKLKQKSQYKVIIYENNFLFLRICHSFFYLPLITNTLGFDNNI